MKQRLGLLFRASALLVSCWLTMALNAGGVVIRAQLVWGTDGAKPEGYEYRELNAEMRNKLINNLRWKNYYILKSEERPVTKEPCRFSLSERCSVGLKPNGKGSVEVQIFNPMAAKPTEPVFTESVSLDSLQKGHGVVIGSNSKDRWDDAWLVIVTAGN